jgi:hypothetical protein
MFRRVRLVIWDQSWGENHLPGKSKARTGATYELALLESGRLLMRESVGAI